MNTFYTETDHFVLLPAIMLGMFGCAVLLLDVAARRTKHHDRWLLVLTLAGFAFTGFALFRQGRTVANDVARVSAFHGALVLDTFSLFFNWMLLAGTALVCLLAYRFLDRVREPLGEFLSLTLFAQMGMFFLVTGSDLITLFLGLETVSICFYVLTGYLRSDARSSEAAIKYLLLGAFSSAILLYGFSLLYGLTGSTVLSEIAAGLSPDQGPVLFLAVATSGIGMLFKVAAVPFHMWVPDAYEGAPSPVTAYLAVASKASAFAFLLRVFLGPLAVTREWWEPAMVVVAVATLTVGNLGALTQSNVKRLLAYSSVGHAGYVLLGLIAGNSRGLEGIAVYLLVYTFMTVGAFLVLSLLERDGVPVSDLDDFNGLASRHPAYAFWMLLFLVSLAGLPPTAGFLGKYYIFWALIETGHYWLATVAALYVAVALYFYFRLVRAMFLGETRVPAAITGNWAAGLALSAAVIITAIGGLYPEPLLSFARSIAEGRP